MRALFLLVLLLLSCGQPFAETISLTPGAVHSRSLSSGRPYHFRFTVPADRLLRLVVEQRGVDVVVFLKDSSGRVLFEVDSPTGAKGPETVLAVTPAAGKYTLVVEPFASGKQGAFVLMVREVRLAGKEDRLRAVTAAGLARAERRRLGRDFEGAVPAYREALPGLEALGERSELARTQWRLGESLRETGELTEAAAVLEGAANLFRAQGDGLGEARALNALGVARRLLGEPGSALQAHERALGLYRAAGEPSGEAMALNDLALVLESRGDLQGAIDRYEEALVLWRQVGARPAEAATLQNLGSLYIMIGQDDEGMDLLRQALERVEGAGEKERVPVLIEMGWAQYLSGHPEAALKYYQEALLLARRLKNPLTEAGAWDRQGTALRALHRYGEAAASYSRALEMCRAARSALYQGHTLANLGWLDLETGAVERGRERLQEALGLLRASGDPNGEIFARVGLSRADRRLGDFGPAREQAERAVQLVEKMRTGLQGPLSRGQFLATRYSAFEELVALLLDLHRQEPGKGHVREALEVAERARARNLSEDLVGERTGASSSRRRILQAEIQAMDVRRQSIAAEDARDPRLQDLDAELRSKGMELDRLDAAGARPSGFQPIGATRIQSLADQDSVFLVYLLSEPASFAWTVDRDGIEPHLLPDRKRIEALARRVVAALSQKNEVAGQAAARAIQQLSDAVIAPLADRLEGRRRLVVLADGALHLVPFSALSAKAGGGMAEPLLVRHEIVLVPSATFLAEQRRRLARREPAPGAVAVLADPVFSPEDARLSGDTGWTARASTGRGFDPGRFRRLPFTAEEAAAIVRLAPPGETFLALGTEAHRELVTSGALGRFRFVHFATHGLLHPVLPERSGIVLSLMDERGRTRDGFLSAPDVAGLDLPAELVVLSACQTGLGREIRGEGLVGLTQAFFRAGAKRVVVSHWSVQDRATAQLMARFYRGLLGEGLHPAAALRAAQLSIRGERGWGSPYFWAGFSLHGDWQ